MSFGRTLYVVYCGVAVFVLWQVNKNVVEPYMVRFGRSVFLSLDPSHTGRAVPCPTGAGVLQGRMVSLGSEDHNSSRTVCRQLVCRRCTDDSSYLLSVVLHRIFMLRCDVATLRSTVTLTLLALPPLLSRLLAFHRRRRPSPFHSVIPEAVVLSTFPLACFYGFLYYTEVPSLVSVLGTVVLSTQGQHGLAAVVRAIIESSPFHETRSTARCNQLFLSSDKHHMGYIRFRREPTPAPPFRMQRCVATRPSSSDRCAE